MEKFKGRLGPDGNRTGRVKAQAGLTARRICRAEGKPELSEPPMVSRTVEDHQPKVTPGINRAHKICVQRLLSNLPVKVGMYGL